APSTTTRSSGCRSASEREYPARAVRWFAVRCNDPVDRTKIRVLQCRPVEAELSPVARRLAAIGFGGTRKSNEVPDGSTGDHERLSPVPPARPRHPLAN